MESKKRDTITSTICLIALILVVGCITQEQQFIEGINETDENDTLDVEPQENIRQMTVPNETIKNHSALIKNNVKQQITTPLAQKSEIKEDPRRTYKEHLTLGVRIPKEVYGTNFFIKGRYYIKYDGPPFKAIVVYSRRRNGFNDYNSIMERGVFEDIDFDNGLKQKGFSHDVRELLPKIINPPGSRYYYKPYDPCAHIFRISVYDCTYLEQQLRRPCKYLREEDLIKIKPLKSAEKIIFIAEEEKPFITSFKSDTHYCEETDEGFDLAKKGYSEVGDIDDAGTEKFRGSGTDRCDGETHIFEQWCRSEHSLVTGKSYPCPEGTLCKEGACVKK